MQSLSQAQDQVQSLETSPQIPRGMQNDAIAENVDSEAGPSTAQSQNGAEADEESTSEVARSSPSQNRSQAEWMQTTQQVALWETGISASGVTAVLAGFIGNQSTSSTHELFFKAWGPVTVRLEKNRCVMRYGYKDAQNEHGESFERALPAQPTSSASEDGETSDAVESLNHGDVRQNEVANAEAGDEEEKIERLVGLVESEMKEVVVHLLGENEVVTKKGSRIGKSVLIDYAYNTSRRNLRQRDEVFEIPHKRLLKVGMTYEL
ncbi:hypothetical protein ACLOJK_017950 [Asimina triloba]